MKVYTGFPVKIYQYEFVTGGIMESILPLHFKLVTLTGRPLYYVYCIQLINIQLREKQLILFRDSVNRKLIRK